MLQKGSISFIHHPGWINYNHIHRLIWETKETAGFAGIVFVANSMALQKYFYFYIHTFISQNIIYNKLFLRQNITDAELFCLSICCNINIIDKLS